MEARKERVDATGHLAAMKAAREDYAKASTREQKRDASERMTAARKACEASSAAWKALPSDLYSVALRDGLTPAQAVAAKAEIGPSLWPRVVSGVGFLGRPGAMTTTVALEATRAGKRAEHHASWLASPASRVTGAAAAIETRVRQHARAAMGWRDSARQAMDAVTKAKHLRAAVDEERRFLRERSTLPVTSRLACMTMADVELDGEPPPPTRPLGGPLPDNIQPGATAHAGLSAALQAAVDALLAGKLPPRTARDVESMLEGYVETMGYEGPGFDVEAMIEPIDAAVEGGDPNAALEAIAAIAEATGASVTIPDGPIETPTTKLLAASMRARAARRPGQGIAHKRGVRVG